MIKVFHLYLTSASSAATPFNAPRSSVVGRALDAVTSLVLSWTPTSKSDKMDFSREKNSLGTDDDEDDIMGTWKTLALVSELIQLN